ncbi:DUF6131 family protein [Bounagaea algeriensis]
MHCWRSGRSHLRTIGTVLLVAGAAQAIAGRLGHAVGGRAHWF